MALLNKLKSLLGLDDGTDGDRQDTDTAGITVERDREANDSIVEEETPPSTPPSGTDATESKPAEDGPADPSTSVESSSTEAEPSVDDGSGALEESPEGSIGEPVTDAEDEPELDATGDAGAEQDAEPATDLEDALDEPASEPVDETTGDDVTADPGDAPDVDSIREIKGIGPSYATKLSEAGVDSAADLADADAGELSTSTGLSEKRIRGWIERARSR